MKKSLIRAACAAIVGATVAFGGIALTAVPANAASATVTLTSTSSKTNSLPPGTHYAPNATFTFSHAVKSFSYKYSTLNGSLANSGTTGPFVHDGHAFTFPTNGGNVQPYSYTNAAGDRVTITRGANIAGSNNNAIDAVIATVTVDLATPSATVVARGLDVVDKGDDAKGTYWLGLTDHVSVSDNAGGSRSGTVNATYFAVAWDVPTVDTPIIAPALAAIALLGAAGVGGGIIAGRRRTTR